MTKRDCKFTIYHSHMISFMKKACSARHAMVKVLHGERHVSLDSWKMIQPHSLLIRFYDPILIALRIYLLVRRKTTTSQGLPAGALKTGLLKELLSLLHAGGLGLWCEKVAFRWAGMFERAGTRDRG